MDVTMYPPNLIGTRFMVDLTIGLDHGAVHLTGTLELREAPTIGTQGGPSLDLDLDEAEGKASTRRRRAT